MTSIWLQMKIMNSSRGGLKIADDVLLSKTITFLRFPLIVGVVLIHSSPNDVIINGVNVVSQSGALYANMTYLVSEIVARIAVPLFFLISGFLFLYKTDEFTKELYAQKLKKRIKTLLIPYLFWNLAVIVLFFLAQTLLPGLMSGQNKMVADYTVQDWLWAFWNKDKILNIDSNAAPICFQFWFIRDLMVMVLFSPIIYLLVKKLKICILLALGLLWIFRLEIDVPGFSITALFFFTTGVYLAVNKINFIKILQPYWVPFSLVSFLLIITELCLREYDWCKYLHQINILVGMLSVISLSAHFIATGVWKVNAFLSESSFFIYAYHGMFLALVTKFLCRVLLPHTDWQLVALYFMSPAVIIAVGLFLYWLLKRILPRTTAIITGGR